MPPPYSLIVFFAVAAGAQGMNGLLTQPLTYYLKAEGFGVEAVAQAFAFCAMPWVLKPLFGLVTDRVAFLGYHRKSYLLASSSLTVVGYVCMAQVPSPSGLIAILLLVTIGVAASDVVVDAWLVEQGRSTGLVQIFQGHQWTWLNLSAIVSGLMGGWLAHRYDPRAAMQLAVAIMALGPAAIVASTLSLLSEPRIRHRPRVAGTVWHPYRRVITTRGFGTVAGMLVCWNVVPRFTTPLYYHMTDRLQFDQYFLGQLNAIGAVGAVIGALTYTYGIAGRWPLSRSLSIGIGLAAASTAAHLLLVNAASAVALYFLGGLCSMIALLALYSAAAAVCPSEAAAFSFATLMALYSAAGQGGLLLGGYLFTGLFESDIQLLIGVASLGAFGTLVWIPFLPQEFTRRPTDRQATAQGDRNNHRASNRFAAGDHAPSTSVT